MDQIHDEWIRSVIKNRPDLPPANLQRTRQLMDSAVPGAIVEGFERHVPVLDLPDPDDRHVLAIETKADVIVTFNVTDFPEAACAKYVVEIIHPDAFVLRLTDRDASAMLSVMREHRASLSRPPMAADAYLDNLARVGLPKTAERMRSRAADL